MNDSIQFHSHVGADGVLNVQVNLGKNEAAREVVVTIEPMQSASAGPETAKLAWSSFVAQTYGSCAGSELQRHDEGSFESREPLE
jgi:hypothetical protein